MNASVLPAIEGLPVRERNLAMLTLSVSMFLAVLDSMIANIALPSLAQQLAVPPDQTVWVVNSYLAAMTVSLLPFSALGDIRGYRPVYLFGLIVFTLASLACGLAHTLPVLLVARVFQGIGAAGITSVNMALVRYIYPRGRLGQGMGLIGLVVAAAATAGPSIAASILAVAPWQALFLFNVPFGFVALAMALRSLPVTPGSGHRFDIFSALLNALALGLVFTGFDGLGHHGGRTLSMIELGCGMAMVIVFVRRQLSLAAPMLPVDLLRLPPFAISVGTSIAAYTCQTMAFLSLPFYFQYVGGQSAIQTGLHLTAWPAALTVVAPLAGRLSDRYSAGVLCGNGLVILTAGMLLLMQASPQGSAITPLVLCGIGFGLFQSSNNRAFMVSAPPARSGACAGMMTTSRLLGQGIGAGMVAISFALTGTGQQGVKLGAITAMGIGAAAAAVAMTISFGRLTRRRAGFYSTKDG